MFDEFLAKIDSKIDKAQYAVSNGVPYTDYLMDLQEIRTAAIKMKDGDNNKQDSASIIGGKNETS